MAEYKVLKYEEFISEAKAEHMVSVKVHSGEGTMLALDYTSAGSNDLIEVMVKGHREMIPKKDIKVL